LGENASTQEYKYQHCTYGKMSLSMSHGIPD